MTVQLGKLTGETVAEGKYALGGKLGSGNFGTVYRASERLNGMPVRDVALKLYSPDASRHGTVEGMLSDCTLPARILASDAPPEVKRHFAQIYDFGYLDTPAGRCAFVSMELIRGAETLRNLSDRYHSAGRFLKPDRILDYLTQFFTALDAAHRAGVLHRDIKGANVMLDAGVVRVMDFGMGANLDEPGAALKTTMSIYAPENFDGRHTAASDVYQAGLMFYELYTGIDPFRAHGIEASLATDPIRERLMRTQFRYLPGKQIDGLPYDEFIDSLLRTCVEPNEARRFGSAAAVLGALQRSDTVATAAQAMAGGDVALAVELAEAALARPSSTAEQRIKALTTIAQANAHNDDPATAISRYREAISLAESSGAYFHRPSEFNALVDSACALYHRSGRTGLARLLAKKRK